MPQSTYIFKKETIDYICSNFTTDCRILDVGAGIGTYSHYLTPLGYSNLDCVEVFEPYISGYSLETKYKKVINEDITKSNIDFAQYDLVIFGDIIEHISEEDSVKVLSKIPDYSTSVIVAVPFMAPQGVHFDNTHEIHIQDKLTYQSFLNIHPNYLPFCLKNDYGIFLNRNPVNENQPLFVYEHFPEFDTLVREYQDRNIIKDVK